MKNKLVLGLGLLTGSVAIIFLVLLLLAKSGAEKETAKGDDAVYRPGTKIPRSSLPNPPPTPAAVSDPGRVRQSLQPGKTYKTHSKGTLHVKATDKDWGVEEVITLLFVFEALVDREIEENDGKTIVELRHFRAVRSLKVESKLEDIRIDLGPAGSLLLAGIGIAAPEAAPALAAIIFAIDGSHLKPVLDTLRFVGVSPEEISGLSESAKMFGSVDCLTGKSVRLTYVDGKGVIQLEPVRGEMTAAERDFHMASILLSDSLIIPDANIKIGSRWTVDGSNFTNLIDPTLLARTSGDVLLERGPDHIVGGKDAKECRQVRFISGRLLFEDSDPRVGVVGHFEPQGSLYFWPQEQFIVQAKLRGKAVFERFSKDHLLFEARMRQVPELELLYDCQIVTSEPK